MEFLQIVCSQLYTLILGCYSYILPLHTWSQQCYTMPGIHFSLNEVALHHIASAHWCRQQKQLEAYCEHAYALPPPNPVLLVYQNEHCSVLHRTTISYPTQLPHAHTFAVMSSGSCTASCLIGMVWYGMVWYGVVWLRSCLSVFPALQCYVTCLHPSLEKSGLCLKLGLLFAYYVENRREWVANMISMNGY